MATRGRKPKPTAIKKLRGNPGRRPLPVGEPQPSTLDLAALPEPPEYLPGPAKAKWREALPTLAEMRVITRADLVVYEMFCLYYAEYVEHTIKVGKEGAAFVRKRVNAKGQEVPKSDYIVYHPSKVLRDSAFKNLLRILPEIGFTPSSRARLRQEDKGESDDFDDLREMLLG